MKKIPKPVWFLIGWAVAFLVALIFKIRIAFILLPVMGIGFVLFALMYTVFSLVKNSNNNQNDKVN